MSLMYMARAALKLLRLANLTVVRIIVRAFEKCETYIF